ncbi:hypothetical protein FHS19_002185 [Paenibacillus rhizosphaerae]|uniref:Uncharacterized protein n=1 Tax=Paenibacillus rhizosphaerae TaxID=297318 RepID=A0A839TLN2_9BACL|nr:hypothetical protein [Paenibacillus rhizosphaerae]
MLPPKFPAPSQAAGSISTGLSQPRTVHYRWITPLPYASPY